MQRAEAVLGRRRAAAAGKAVVPHMSGRQKTLHPCGTAQDLQAAQPPAPARTTTPWTRCISPPALPLAFQYLEAFKHDVPATQTNKVLSCDSSLVVPATRAAHGTSCKPKPGERSLLQAGNGERPGNLIVGQIVQ